MEEISVLRLLELVALATASFLGFHFIRSHDKNEKYLGAFLLLGFFFDFIFSILYTSNIEFLFDLLPNSSLLYTPFLYYYALSLTGQTDKKMWKLLFPAAFFYITNLVAILFNVESLLLIEMIFTYSFAIYVAYLVLRIIHVHQKNILQYFSSVEDKNLNWLRVLTLITIGFNCFWIIEDGISLFTDWDHFLPEISTVSTIITIYWIGFSSLKQEVIFNEEILPIECNSPRELNDTELTLFDQLTQLMKTEQLYKRKNISLGEVSQKLQVSNNMLSRVINVKTSDNFYNYINTYRIECFIKVLLDTPDQKLTLFGLAQECGFKTKTTFYSAFKKHKGCTPNEFYQKIKYK